MSWTAEFWNASLGSAGSADQEEALAAVVAALAKLFVNDEWPSSSGCIGGFEWFRVLQDEGGCQMMSSIVECYIAKTCENLVKLPLNLHKTH